MARNAAKKAYEENLGIDTFEFIKKKILRFMPDIYVAWVIAFVVKHWHFVSWKQVVKDLLHLSGNCCFNQYRNCGLFAK